MERRRVEGADAFLLKGNNDGAEMLIQCFGGTRSLAWFNLEFQIFTPHGIDDIHFPRNYGCAHYKNSLYVAGGNFDSNSSIPCDFFYELHWRCGTRRAPLPTNRSHLSLAFLSSKSLVATGGVQGVEALKRAEMFLHTLDAWVGVPAMKEARSSHASTGFLD